MRSFSQNALIVIFVLLFYLPTLSHSAMQGDFNGDGVVSIAEVQTCINSFLGILPVNSAPVANAGTAQSVVANTVVTLDGSSSNDANGDLLTYSWAFTSKPLGSSATLSSATTVKPTFTADVAGAYVFNLVVNDGKVNSPVLSSVYVIASSNTIVLKLSSQGTLPAGKKVSGLHSTIELPAGVTAKTAGGVVDATVVVGSGLLATTPSTMVSVNYTPATANAKAKLDFSIASTAYSGVDVGEYATITLIFSGGNPNLSDFNVTSFEACDLGYAVIPALTLKMVMTVL